MKFFKSTGGLLLLVALVVSYAYFFEYKGKEKQEQTQLEQKKIVPFSLEEIVGFKVKTKDVAYEFEKVKLDDQISWKIKSPIEDDANYAAVQGFLSQFGQEAFDEVAQEGDSTNFGIYGLDEAEDKINTIEFIRDVNDPSKNLKIQVGEETGLAGKKYLRLNNENRVLVAGYFWESQFTKSFGEFRETNFVPHNFSFSEIEIRNKNDHYKLVENDSLWTVHKLVNNAWIPNEVVSKDADRAAIDDIYYQIKNLRATKIFKEGKEPESLARLGLAHPGIIVVLSNGKEGMLRKELRFQFSDSIAGQIYATSNIRNLIFSLNPPAVNALKLTPLELRDKKKPLKFDSDKVDEINFRSDLVSFKIKKSGEKWVSTVDIGEQVINQAKVSDLIEKLSQMKIKKYLKEDTKYQKSGMSELILKADAQDILEVEWSPKPKEDFFIAKSNLSDELFAISMSNIGSLPLDEVIGDSPKETNPAQEEKK